MHVTSLSELLWRVAGELRALESMSDTLQSTLTGACLADRPAAGATADLQQLDLLSQTLDGLSSFLDALASSAPEHWTLDADRAVSDLKLAAVARRLAGAKEPLARDADQGSGEVELFG